MPEKEVVKKKARAAEAAWPSHPRARASFPLAARVRARAVARPCAPELSHR